MTTPSTRHALDAIGARRVWHYPLPADPLRLVEDLHAHGITGLVPQQSANAVAWSRRWAAPLAREGLDVVVGLGKISAKNILDALEVPATAGCMVNQEDWKSVRESRAVCDEVLRLRPDAAARTVDCHYPCLTVDPETERRTGWGKIAAAWASLCGLRAPQCYWASGGGGTVEGPRDGWVAARLAWSRRDYPRAGGSPGSRVRLARQLYRASVNDHVVVLLAESSTGSVWLWNWPETDAAARLALRIVHALEQRGHRGITAVRDFQLAAGLDVDGVVGPATCGALGLEVPEGITWTRRRRAALRELAFVEGRDPGPGEACVEFIEDGWVLRGPEVPGSLYVDPVLVPAAPGTWHVEGTGIVLRDVPERAPWELPLDPGA